VAATKKVNTKSKNYKQSKLKKVVTFFNPRSLKGGMALFALVFALSGGGYFVYSSFAATSAVISTSTVANDGLSPSHNGNSCGSNIIKESSKNNKDVLQMYCFMSGQNDFVKTFDDGVHSGSGSYRSCAVIKSGTSQPHPFTLQFDIQELRGGGTGWHIPYSYYQSRTAYPGSYQTICTPFGYTPYPDNTINASVELRGEVGNIILSGMFTERR
jgi:hypothetical protein